jgi:hypothetical protein
MPGTSWQNQVSVQDKETVPASAHVTLSSYESEYDSEMQLRYNYRLYPSPGQCQAMARAFGCARVVFNDGLRTDFRASRGAVDVLVVMAGTDRHARPLRLHR